MARIKASTYLLRCRPDTLQRARIVARASGVSLRVWIEGAMLASLQDAPEVPAELLNMPKLAASVVSVTEAFKTPGVPDRVPSAEPPRPVRPKARI